MRYIRPTSATDNHEESLNSSKMQTKYKYRYTYVPTIKYVQAIYCTYVPMYIVKPTYSYVCVGTSTYEYSYVYVHTVSEFEKIFVIPRALFILKGEKEKETRRKKNMREMKNTKLPQNIHHLVVVYTSYLVVPTLSVPTYL